MTLCRFWCWIAVAWLAGASSAWADTSAGSSARAIGRAGATLVSEDGGAALVQNPAGMVRRSSWRLGVGLGLRDSDVTYVPSDGPTIRDQAAPERQREIALMGGFGRWVIGAAYLAPPARARALPTPDPERALDPAEARAFPHRYSGLSARYAERHIALGAAVRATDWLGLGVAVRVSSVRAAERRHISAGWDERDGLGDPARDLTLAFDTSGTGVGVTAGALVAPPTLPLELAVGGDYQPRTSVTGSAEVAYPTAGVPPTTPIIALASEITSARTERPEQLTVRAGVRYLGALVTAEVDGELVLHPNPAATWSVTGVSIIDIDLGPSQLTEVPTLDPRRRLTGAVRATIEMEALPGLAWLTVGYAYRVGTSDPDTLAPASADLGGHTAALGLETYHAGLTLGVGYSRRFARPHRRTDSDLRRVSVFHADPTPDGLGRYRDTEDAFAATLEIAWE